MKRVLGIIVGLVLFCVVSAAAIFGLVMFLTQDLAKAGDDFMQAIQDNRLEDAYAMLGGEALDDVSFEEFEATFADSGMTSWNFNSRNVNNNMGDLSGTAQVGDITYNVGLVLEKVDDSWLIIGYNFEPVESSED